MAPHCLLQTNQAEMCVVSPTSFPNRYHGNLHPLSNDGSLNRLIVLSGNKWMFLLPETCVLHVLKLKLCSNHLNTICAKGKLHFAHRCSMLDKLYMHDCEISINPAFQGAIIQAGRQDTLFGVQSAFLISSNLLTRKSNAAPDSPALDN